MGIELLLPGVAHALTVTFVGYPFDTIKTRLQDNPKYGGSINCVKEILKKEGIKGFYRGVSSPLISHLIKRPYQFPVFEYLTKEKHLNNYVAGAISGATGSVLGTPLQVIKVNSQASDVYKNAFDFTTQHYKSFGVKGFYKGFAMTMTKDVIFGATFLGTYNVLRTINGNKTNLERFINGATAHATSWIFFMPIDYLKTKIQRGNNLKIHDVIRGINGNYMVMWKGVVPSVLRTIPVSGFGMIAYEFMNDCIKNKGLQ